MIENFKDLEKAETKRILDDCNIPINWLGYKFIVTAIPMIIDAICEEEKVIMKKIYKDIASKHKTTASKVEYAIRYVRENTGITHYLGKTKLTNQRLLFVVANRIMKKLNI